MPGCRMSAWTVCFGVVLADIQRTRRSGSRIRVAEWRRGCGWQPGMCMWLLMFPVVLFCSALLLGFREVTGCPSLRGRTLLSQQGVYWSLPFLECRAERVVWILGIRPACSYRQLSLAFRGSGIVSKRSSIPGICQSANRMLLRWRWL